MNNQVKLVLGALVGAGVGYFVGEVTIEVIALREATTGMLPIIFDEPETDRKLPQAEEKQLMSNGNKKDYSKYFGRERPDLAALAAKYNGDSVQEENNEPEEVTSWSEEEFDEIIEDRVEEDNDIVIIPDFEFEDADGIEKIELLYYDDDVVTDTAGSPIDRPEQLLGDDALVSFGEFSDDADVVYVRNDNKRALYKVVRLNKEYASPVLRRGRAKKAQLIKEEGDGEETS